MTRPFSPRQSPKQSQGPKFKEELEQESLQKDTPASGSAQPSLEFLEKQAWAKKVAAQAKEFAKPKKAKVCLDWRNTLEKGNIVPDSHIQHLQLLMEHCSVLICSYVRSKSREQEVRRNVLALEKAMGLAFHFPLFFTYEKQGSGGKLEKMWYHHVDYMVDDSWQVCKETLEKGYPTVTPIAVQTLSKATGDFKAKRGSLLSLIFQLQSSRSIRVLARICLKHIFRMIHVYIVACGPKACGRATNFAIFGPSSSV